ncbi:MAG: LLM class F420-dependent oxidoreductase [Microthrixaceae bacterium]
MQLGVLPAYRSGLVGDPDSLVRFATSVESAGIDTLYLVEHVAVAANYAGEYPYSDTGRMPLPEDCPIPDPLELTAFLAAHTEGLFFSTGVLVAPHHHPLVLAKRLATLDLVSGGRVDAGFGIGWMREEVEATGASFATRGRRTTEMLRALRCALDDDPASFEGEFFSFDDMRVHPRSGRRIRLDVGGHGEAAARRAGMVGDGYHPLGLDDSTLASRWALVCRTAEEHGRDPSDLDLSVTVPLSNLDHAVLGRLEEIGVGRVVLSTAGVFGAELEEPLAAAVEMVRGL